MKIAGYHCHYYHYHVRKKKKYSNVLSVSQCLCVCDKPIYFNPEKNLLQSCVFFPPEKFSIIIIIIIVFIPPKDKSLFLKKSLKKAHAFCRRCRRWSFSPLYPLNSLLLVFEREKKINAIRLVVVVVVRLFAHAAFCCKKKSKNFFFFTSVFFVASFKPKIFLFISTRNKKHVKIIVLFSFCVFVLDISLSVLENNHHTSHIWRSEPIFENHQIKSNFFLSFYFKSDSFFFVLFGCLVFLFFFVCLYYNPFAQFFFGNQINKSNIYAVCVFELKQQKSSNLNLEIFFHSFFFDLIFNLIFLCFFQLASKIKKFDSN